MHAARAILGLCLVVVGCDADSDADTDANTDGASATETESSATTGEEGSTDSATTTTSPATTSDSTTSSTSEGSSGAITASTSGDSTETSGGVDTTSAEHTDGGAESSTTDPDGHPFQGDYEGTMAADCLVGLLSGLLEFTVDESGEVTGEAAVSFGAAGPLVAPVSGSVQEDGDFAASATVGGALGSCTVTGTIFGADNGSGVFSCPEAACDGTWILI